MSNYVVLVYGEDDSTTVVGTPAGEPFTSLKTAARTVAKYEDKGLVAVAMMVRNG